MPRFLSVVLAIVTMVACCPSAYGSTAAFAGTVTAVDDCPSNAKDCRRQFTVTIDYFDYISWGKFGRHSKTGETITRRVKTQGTVCVLNGRLTNSKTFAAAIDKGQWGYFYEDTWLDLFTTPNFQWGELVGHDAAKKQFTLRIHRTHKDIHLASNPPETVRLSYDDATSFRLERESVGAADCLAKGNWLQVHPPREQIVLVRTPDAAFDSSELLPAEEGRRGFANDLTARGVLKACRTKNATGVLDVGVEIDAQRTLQGKTKDLTLNCKKVSFVLDGKLAPVGIAAQPGREIILCHYRSEKSPHKILVQSRDDAVRGKVKEIAGDGSAVVITTLQEDGKPRDVSVRLDARASYQLDGRPSTASDALKPGREVAIHPKRGRTIIGFAPVDVE